MKVHALQLVFHFAYGTCPTRGAVFGAHAHGYAAALAARVEAAFAAAPYALSLAARTDAGVAARRNVLSCRLRLAGPPSDHALAANLAHVRAPRGDGIDVTDAFAFAERVAARADVGAKTYHYGLGPLPAGADVAAAHALVNALMASRNFVRFATACRPARPRRGACGPRCTRPSS